MLCLFTFGQIGRVINGFLRWRIEPDMDLIAHPSIFSDTVKFLSWPDKNGNLVVILHLPESVSEILVLKRKRKLVLDDFSNPSEL